MTRLQNILEYAIKGDPNWAFHRMMISEDRTAFDNMLVEIQHPLCYEPGTTEGRFYRYISMKRRTT